MKRISGCIVVSALHLGVCLSAGAEQPTKVARIGYVSATGNSNNPGPSVEAFRRGLRHLGYVEGKNLLVDYRYLEGTNDRVSNFVAELIELKVDVLIAVPSPAIRAAKQATKTIPIVIVTTVDPVATGLVDSLARPGGNVTGLTRLTRELSGKRLELLKELVPGITTVGVLSVGNASSPSNALEDYTAAGLVQKIPLQPLKVYRPKPDLDRVFQEASKNRLSAIITADNTVLLPHQKQIANLAMKYRLPSMFERISNVEAGGLVSYSSNAAEIFMRAAWYVDKILKGAKPADLPVE